jgi:hypothetical protein
VASGEKLDELSAEAVFPNHEMEFDMWQRQIWGISGTAFEQIAATYKNKSAGSALFLVWASACSGSY